MSNTNLHWNFRFSVGSNIPINRNGSTVVDGGPWPDKKNVKKIIAHPRSSK